MEPPIILILDKKVRLQIRRIFFLISCVVPTTINESGLCHPEPSKGSFPEIQLRTFTMFRMTNDVEKFDFNEMTI